MELRKSPEASIAKRPCVAPFLLFKMLQSFGGAARLMLGSMATCGAGPAATSMLAAAGQARAVHSGPAKPANIWCVGRNYEEHIKELGEYV